MPLLTWCPSPGILGTTSEPIPRRCGAVKEIVQVEPGAQQRGPRPPKALRKRERIVPAGGKAKEVVIRKTSLPAVRSRTRSQKECCYHQKNIVYKDNIQGRGTIKSKKWLVISRRLKRGGAQSEVRCRRPEAENVVSGTQGFNTDPHQPIRGCQPTTYVLYMQVGEYNS
jgi:hypothetical protein